MSFLKKLKTTEKVEKPKDSLGGVQVRPSAINTFKIKNIYFLPAVPSGAMMCHLTVTDEAGLDYRESICVASGDAKGNKSTYTNAKGEAHYLPGYIIINDIAMLTIETDITDLETETITVKHYDKEAKKEVPTEVEVVTEMIGEEVQLAIKHIIKNKQEQINGKYVDVNDRREINEIAAAFHSESDQTLNEAIADTDAEFKQKWLDKNEGKPFDTFKEVSASKGGNSFTSKNKGDSAAGGAKKSMFTKGG